MSLSRFCLGVAALLAAGTLAARAPDHLTSRPLPQTPADKALKVGDKLVTAPGDQRRVTLPDRSVVYVRQGTTLSVTKDSAVELSAGEVFVETAGGKLAPTVTVKTPKRTLQARDSRFGVRAGEDGTSVVVATGSVKVDGVTEAVQGGQSLSEKAEKPARAGRVSHLVAWTRELRTAGQLVPTSEHSGGTLVARDPDGQEAKLELRRYHVDVHVEDGFARTTIDQTYFNHAQDRLEGTFRFPLPPDASLCRLAMYVDGNLMEGGMAERDHARAAYERIVWEKRDPALLEWVDGSTFKMRVFPLEPRQEKRLLLSYVQRLPVLNGQATYRFPTGHSLNEVGQWSMGVVVVGGADGEWACDSHKLKARKDGRNLNLQASEKNAKLDRDVTLTLTEKKSEEVRFSTMTQDGSTYLMVRYRPELIAPREPQRRDWVVLVETSGDRDPLLARTQIELVRSFLANAGRDDTFVVLTGSTRTKALRPKAVRNDSAAIEEVMADLEKAHLVGAFDLGAALTAAKPHLESAKAPYLIHVGSGIPAMGERTPAELLKRLPKGARYVGVGVGRRWERSLMQTLAEKTGGYFTQVNPDESVGWRGLELASTLDTPRLLDAAVSDADGKTTFLPFGRLISQGEELAAVTRIKGDMPARVRISGTLEGKPFSREIEVKDASDRAGYLPRAWAKLEIDRLLADDAGKHKDAIVALSKAAYVMTPFTSLIVLESDDQYKQFKIDRGQKNQWAQYPAPGKIKVVVEPLDGDEGDAKEGIKPSRRTVAKSVVRRSGGGDVEKLMRGFNAMYKDGRYAEAENLAMRAHELDPDNGLARAAIYMSRRSRTVNEYNAVKERKEQYFLRALNEGESLLAHDPQSATPRRTDLARTLGSAAGMGAAPMEVGADRAEDVSVAGGALRIFARGARESDETASNQFGYYPPALALVVRGNEMPRPRPLGSVVGNERALPLYQRPSYSANDRAFFDLLAYAPGLNSSAADLLAVLDAEARPDPASKPGRIDARAKALLDAARKPAWRTLTIPAQGLSPAYKIAFDGAGKYAWERTLSSGLKEKVVCDGKTLHHVYAELGLASKRSISRHHEADFAARVPFVAPSAEELTRGADVTCVDDTVSVVPHGAKDAKKYLTLRLSFVKGRLAERRVVEMPGEKILRSERYAESGEVTVSDGDKRSSVIKSALADADAPSLKPAVGDLVVLDLPYRTPAHLRKTLKVEQKAADALTFAQATQLVAAYAAAGDVNQARAVFDAALARRDERQIGYYVLLASCGANLDSDNLDVLDAHPHEPLAHYLSLHSSLTLRKHASRWAAASNVWGEGMLRRLGLGHAFCQRWASGKALGTSVSQRRTERGRALDYVKAYRGSDLAWALLGLMQDRTAEESNEAERRKAYLELAKAYELFADSASLGGLARYEQARCEWRGGEKESARKRFTALYRAARKDDRLLWVDADFREALMQATPAWPELLRETAKDLLQKKDRASVLLLADQCWQLDDRVSSRRLLAQAIDGLSVKGDENLALYGAAVGLLRQTEQRDEADRLVTLLLEDEKHATKADLWRVAAELAAQREQPARALACREKALALEYAAPADVVNLDQVRRDYRALLTNYADLTRSLATLSMKAPADFRDRVVSAADRWRAMDREQADACRLAAAALRTLGDRELAFDYLTTPVGLRPGESDVWESLASTLVRQGERDLADRAYRSAFERESTNAQILWDRAENLHKAGRTAAAKALYQQIAESDWQPRFATLKQQARWMGEER